MDNIYMLADTIIFNRIGGNLKAARLKQNITQQSLADAADMSLSSLKKIEKGEIGSFDSLLRVLRTLGKLDVLQPLVDEEQLSPSGMLLQQRNITEYHFKRLLIWRSQVQALAGPHKVQEKSWTFSFLKRLDFKKLTDIHVNPILTKSYSCGFSELLKISALFNNWFTSVDLLLT